MTAGPTSGSKPAHARTDAPFRVEPASALAFGDRRRTVDQGRDGLDRRERDEREPRWDPRAARDRRTKARASVVMMNRPIESEMASRRTSV
jgi:hypothetical protein